MSDGKSHDGGICLACGGSVDAHGMATGGQVDGDEETPETPEEQSDESAQMELRERLRSFGNALGKKT